MLLILDYSDKHFDNVLLDILAYARKSEHLLEYLVSNLFWRYLCIQDMLLEESILAVHVGAIEESIAINDFIPVVLTNIVIVVIFLILDVVLMAANVLLLDWAGCWQCLSCLSISLEAKRPILSLYLSCRLLSSVSLCFFLSSFIIEGLIETTKLFVKIDEDVCSGDLD